MSNKVSFIYLNPKEIRDDKPLSESIFIKNSLESFEEIDSINIDYDSNISSKSDSFLEFKY